MTATVGGLATPALLVDAAILAANLETMAAALPGARLRPHVKAHKCTALAAQQRAAGHPGFTVATVREAEGMHAAGLGGDLLLANEVLDLRRIGALVADGARVTVAVDSEATIAAALAGGVHEVVIDVMVGLPRCGCPPERAGELAALARRRGLHVRGVMGYEGHLMMVADPGERAAALAKEMTALQAAHEQVGGELVSSGGTGTYAEHAALGVATEVQAGSYALMDHAYAGLGLPFGTALALLATVVSTNPAGWAVCDVGLKSHGMDHGDPVAAGHPVWFLSDEHTTVANAPEHGASGRVVVGEQLVLIPGHVDPTVAMHEQLWLVDGFTASSRVLARWPVDLRGW